MQWFQQNSSNIWNPGCCCVFFSGVSPDGGNFDLLEGITWGCVCIEADEIDDGVIVRDYFQLHTSAVTSAISRASENHELRIDILNYEESTRRRQFHKRTFVIVVFAAAILGLLLFYSVSWVIAIPVMICIFLCVNRCICVRARMTRYIPLLFDFRRLIPLQRHISGIVCQYVGVDPVTVVMSRAL